MASLPPIDNIGRPGDVATAGPEHRYSRPAVDTDSIHTAKMGAAAKSPDHSELPVTVPASKINTAGGPMRGTKAGAMLPNPQARS